MMDEEREREKNYWDNLQEEEIKTSLSDSSESEYIDVTISDKGNVDEDGNPVRKSKKVKYIDDSKIDLLLYSEVPMT